MIYDRKGKKIIEMKRVFSLIAIVLLLVACSEDVTSNRPDGDKRFISFGVMEGDAVSVTIEDINTRSSEQKIPDVTETVVEAETDFPISEQLCLTITDEPCIHKGRVTRGSLQNTVNTRSLVFGVTEFVKDQTTAPVFSNSVPMAQNTTLDGDRELFMADETWQDDAYGGQQYDFYAYAPQVSAVGQRGITLSNNNRTITYNAANVDVGDQPDLMTARKATSAYVGIVPLTFQHRLCAIQIKTSGTWAAGYHVSAVKFLNVISSGTFDIDTDKDAAWSSKGAAGVYEVSGFTQADATNTVVTGPDDKWLMMVPQTLNRAKISITLTDGSSNSYTVVAPISAYTWTAGHMVTYTISPASIASMTVNSPSAGSPATYATSDQFGLFVLDRDNKILISNLPVSPTAGDAAASRTLNIPSTIFKSKQYKYFLMYPYTSDLETLVNTSNATNYDNYYKEGITATGRTTDADTFFADVISNWSTGNLQIASLSGDHFDMVQKKP